MTMRQRFRLLENDHFEDERTPEDLQAQKRARRRGLLFGAWVSRVLRGADGETVDPAKEMT